MIELFRTDHVLVRSIPSQDTRRWVVTFDNFGIGPGFDRPGFGQGFLQASGISAIHVMGVGDDWYQYPEMVEAMAAVRAAVQGAERVMTYGSSMGGYAALRFAEGAGANAVLALSPQYSINPALAPFEHRWSQASGRISWLPAFETPLKAQAIPVVVHDSCIEDRLHVEMIRKDIAIQSIRLPYGGHPVTTSLAEMGQLKPLVFQTLSGELDPAAFERQVRSLRRRSPSYLGNLAMAQPPHRVGLALSLARQAFDVAPHSDLARTCLARMQSRQGLHEEAIATMEALAGPQASEPYRVQFAEVLAEAGELERAIALAEEIVTQAPGEAHLLAWKGHLHWRNYEPEAAMDLVRQAQAIDPLNSHFAVTIEAYEAAIRAEEAEAKDQARSLRPRPLGQLLRDLGRKLSGNASSRVK